jgi:acetolactate synthase-1/2/3 large subunit
VEQVTGGDLVVAQLASAGVEVVFGIPSVHNLPIYDALRRHGAIRAVTVRHEQAAAGAADAYARVTGRPGVCITSTGPGAANAMGALLEAFVSSSPVVHLTGQIDSRFLDEGRGFIHEVPDQPAMLGSLCKAVARVGHEAEIPAKLAEALRTATTARQGPVSLEIPIDLQYAPCEASLLTAARDAPPTDATEQCAPDDASVARAVELLAAAERPLLWVGGGAVAAGAEAEVQELARRLGAGVLTSPNGRGVLPEDDPLCIGNLPWDAGVRALCVEADVLVAIGTRFQGPNTQNWQMELPGRIVQVDVDPAVVGRNYPVAAPVVADARLALGAVLAGLGEGGGDGAWTARVAATTAQARADLRATLGPQVGLLDSLEPLVTPGTVVVKDSTIPAYTWGNRLLTVRRTRTSVMPNGFAIGLGLPHAIGAAAAAGRDGEAVVLMVGDGGFMLAPGELATLAEERLGVAVLLFNDGGYGILKNIQDRQYEGRIGVELGSPDFCALARACGVAADRAASVDAYAKLAAEAIDAAREGRPTLVEVDLEAIGPMATPFVGTSRPPAPR